MAIPTLRQLEFLSALGDKESFSRAAEVCNVTQPTLSAAIKELEALLGVQLVERAPRGAKLTQAGRFAVRRAKVILAEAKELVSSIQHSGQRLEGPLNLGAIPTIAPYIFAQTVSALAEAFPAAKPYLMEEKTTNLLEALREHRLDAAIIALPWETPGIQVQSVHDDEFLLALPETHRLADKPALEPEDIETEELLLLEDGHCLRHHSLNLCGRKTGMLGRQVAATSLTTLVQMISTGLGVSLIPRLALSNGLLLPPGIALRSFAQPTFGRSIGVAWRSGSAQESEARLLADLLKDLLAN